MERDDDGKHTTTSSVIENSHMKNVDIQEPDAKYTEAESALQRSEEKYRAIFENAIMGIFQAGSDGRFLSVNKAFADMAGYDSPEEMIETITDMSHQLYVDPEDWQAYTKCIGGGGIIRDFEARLRRKDGSAFFAQMSARAFSGSDGKMVYQEGIVKDITDRRKAEEALQESEERYHIAIENSFDGVAIIQDGLHVYVNRSFIETFGYSDPAEIIGKPHDAIVHPDDLEWVIRLNTLRERGEPTPKRYRFKGVKSDGSTVGIEVSAAHTTYKGRSASLAYLMDLTEKEMAGRALQRSISTLKSILSAVPVGIAIVNAERIPEWMNEALISMTGYGEKEHREKGAHLLYESVEEFERVGKEILEGIERTGIGITNTKWISKIGEVRDVHLRGAAVDPDDISAGIVFAAVDITDQKRAEQALAESEEKYRLVVENSIVGVYIIQEGFFRFVNSRFCDIYGYPVEELIDKMGPTDVVHPNDRPFVEESVRERLSGKVDAMEYTHRAIRKDGQIITVKVLGSRSVFMGRPALLGTVIDITREKTLESQLVQSQKIEAIGMLAGGVAHDFNNILTTLTGYGTLLKMKMAKEDPLLAYVDHILSASNKGAGLTKSLLAFSRHQPLSLAPVNINDLLGGTVKLLKRLLTEDISLDMRLCEEELVVMADATQIDQILFNLVTNARDAMPQGGTLIIETKLVESGDEPAELYIFDKPGKYAAISVSDSGFGMDQATKEKIFEPFFTTKEVGRGTGLGLCTVYGIVQKHNGLISFHSEKNVGTTFLIHLPLANAGKQMESGAFSDGIAHGTETILVAEDNENVRHIVEEVLVRFGYTVITATDGDDAITKFRENSGRIDLAILDSVMPGKNGRMVYDEIITVNPRAKVLFMSGYTRDIVLDKGVEEGKFDFVPKPLAPSDLLKKMRQILDE